MNPNAYAFVDMLPDARSKRRNKGLRITKKMCEKSVYQRTVDGKARIKRNKAL